MQNDDLLTKKQLSTLLGVTTRTIELMVENDKITPAQTRPLLFTFKEAGAYIQRLLSSANSKDVITKNAELAKLEGEARIKQAKAEREELLLKELKGEMHRSEDVKAIVTDHALYIRSMLLAMPGKLAVDVATTNNAAEAAEIIKREVYQVLNNAADYRYDPEEYAKRVREREGLKALEDEEEE